jgi:hypothetical protein
MAMLSIQTLHRRYARRLTTCASGLMPEGISLRRKDRDHLKSWLVDTCSSWRPDYQWGPIVCKAYLQHSPLWRDIDYGDPPPAPAIGDVEREICEQLAGLARAEGNAALDEWTAFASQCPGLVAVMRETIKPRKWNAFRACVSAKQTLTRAMTECF